MSDSVPLQLELSVPFQSTKEAEIVCTTLAVDPEPRRSEVTKTLKVEGNVLHVCFTAKEARMLRVAVGSFMDLLVLTIDTIAQFQPKPLPS